MIAIVGCKKEEKNSIDNSKLKKAIDTYGQYNNDDGKYSISSYKALMDSVDAGMKILEKASCTQEEIDNAEKNIKELAGKLKEDRWTEPLNDAEKNIVIQQCISDYEMLGMDDSDTISTKLTDWDIQESRLLHRHTIMYGTSGNHFFHLLFVRVCSNPLTSVLLLYCSSLSQ